MKPGLKEKQIDALAQLLSNPKHKKCIGLIGALKSEPYDHECEFYRNNELKQLWTHILQRFDKPFYNLAEMLNSVDSGIMEEYLKSKFENKGCSDVQVTRKKLENYIESQCACKHSEICDPLNQKLTRETIHVIGTWLYKSESADKKRLQIIHRLDLDPCDVKNWRDCESYEFFCDTLSKFLEKQSYGATLRCVFIMLESLGLKHTTDMIQKDLGI